MHHSRPVWATDCHRTIRIFFVYSQNYWAPCSIANDLKIELTRAPQQSPNYPADRYCLAMVAPDDNKIDQSRAMNRSRSVPKGRNRWADPGWDSVILDSVLAMSDLLVGPNSPWICLLLEWLRSQPKQSKTTGSRKVSGVYYFSCWRQSNQGDLLLLSMFMMFRLMLTLMWWAAQACDCAFD